MKMTTYGCGVILFMINLCWNGALHPSSETEILGDSRRRGSSGVQEQSCPTWYLETKHNGVTRCACGATGSLVAVPNLLLHACTGLCT